MQHAILTIEVQCTQYNTNDVSDIHENETLSIFVDGISQCWLTAHNTSGKDINTYREILQQMVMMWKVHQKHFPKCNGTDNLQPDHSFHCYW